ncbi:unnamed protein product [Gordionus sp. m RMFG-2023]|uniref:high mobility group protein B1-like n=1 Tax=Gordionus sp. m RMFG-2023 TaxID=3053472 RepID=UPI0030DF7BB4
MARDGKPKGRTNAYAFFVQTCREEQKSKCPNDKLVFREFSKMCAEKWKTMDSQAKTLFREMAEKDGLRYKNEMATYDGPKSARKRKKEKDPKAPKRALSAFFFFSMDERPKIKQAHPSLSVCNIAKKLGHRWSRCPPDLKLKYEKKAMKDKERYAKEILPYRTNKETNVKKRRINKNQ